jgi:hypothetical protein
VTESQQCSGFCGDNGTGRVLPLTDEYFYRRTGRRGLVFGQRCKDCVLARQRERAKRQAAERSEFVKYRDTVPRERRPRRISPAAYWQETPEERSARIVDSYIPRFKWETTLTVIAWLLLMLASPAVAHDWYEEMLIPGSKQSCCNDRDCHPVPDCSSPGDLHRGVVIEGRCIEVAPQNVLPMDSPDARVHACWSPKSTPITIRCAVFPQRSV